jgi:hypothetical protein
MTRQSTSMRGTRRATLDDSTINFNGRHDNGDGRYTGKGQQGDRMHNDFDGRHDDDKGQQGSRRHNDGNKRAR